MLVILPIELRERMHKAIDEALQGRPCDEHTREYLFNWLLCYWDEHGIIPVFTLKEMFENHG